MGTIEQLPTIKYWTVLSDLLADAHNDTQAAV